MEVAGSSEMSVSTYQCIRYQNRKDCHQKYIHREILTTYHASISSDGDTGSRTDRHAFYVRDVFIALLSRPTPDNETKLEVPWLHDPLLLSCLLLILYTSSLKCILWRSPYAFLRAFTAWLMTIPFFLCNEWCYNSYRVNDIDDQLLLLVMDGGKNLSFPFYFPMPKVS